MIKDRVVISDAGIILILGAVLTFLVPAFSPADYFADGVVTLFEIVSVVLSIVGAALGISVKTDIKEKPSEG